MPTEHIRLVFRRDPTKRVAVDRTSIEINWYTPPLASWQPQFGRSFMESNGGETHTHEETTRDEHTNEDGSRVEQETTERTEAEQPSDKDES